MKSKVFLFTCVFFICIYCVHGAILNVPSALYPRIQDGIDAAAAGDTVLVADGTYFMPRDVDLDFRGKAITVRNANGPFYCILDCQNTVRGVRFVTNETSTSVFEGFWIKNGYSYNSPAGAGILCIDSSPLITNCVISNCQAWYASGGGMHVIDGSPTVEYTTFYQNFADFNAGGVFNALTTDDKACAPFFNHCDFIENVAETGMGGGMMNENSWPSLGNCQFIYNFAHLRGGGMYNDNSSVPNSPLLWNTAFFWNNEYHSSSNGGAIYNYASSPGLGNCTFTENGGQECVYSDAVSLPYFLNCILYFDYGTEFGGPGTHYATYSDVQGGWPGTGNINLDPRFAGTYAGPGFFDGDIHICWDSPCRETGSNVLVPQLLTDIEGDPRPTYANFDMGADEFARRLYAIPDYRNYPFFITGGNANIRMAGQPGWAAGLYYGTGVLSPPLLTAYGYLYLQSPILVVNGTIPAQGIYDYPLVIPAAPPGPYEVPFQALVGPMLTNLYMFRVAF